MSHVARMVLVALALGAPRPALPAEKTLHWRLLEVEARLDAAGDLHVVERQAMVFTGDWNGGERTFRVGPGQRLQLHRLLRLDEDGVLRPLAQGSLDRVDQYAWVPTKSHTLRWRSRLPADPPFEATEITYILEYTLSGVLERGEGGTHRLRHDFAFPDRPGPIREVRATLSLDPSWHASRAPLALSLRDLPPGRDAVITVPLRWVGQGRPPGAGVGADLATPKRSEPRPFIAPSRGPLIGAPPFPAPLRVPLVVAMTAGLALAAAWVYRHGRSRGQFERLPEVDAIDEAWLREHVLVHPPEVVGAILDGEVGAPEVSAVLARMVAQGKLETLEMRRFFGLSRGLHLRLRVDRATLDRSERRLVDGLFFEGDTTDTWRLRRHYRRTGFDPASRLSGEVRDRARALLREAPLARRPWLAVAGLAAMAVLFGGLTVAAGTDFNEVAVPTIAGMILFIFSGAATSRLAVGAGGLLVPALAVVLPLALWLGGIGWLAWRRVDVSVWAILCDAAVWGAAVAFVALRSRTPLSRKAMELRRCFETARRHFARELRRPQPVLRDEWIPYLLALGLGKGMDRWVRVHGAGAASPSSQALAEGGATTPLWSGGGGEFSGGGASGSWAALGSISSPISPPSSSGGSGSSGSSSGGGGGGGW